MFYTQQTPATIAPLQILREFTDSAHGVSVGSDRVRSQRSAQRLPRGGLKITRFGVEEIDQPILPPDTHPCAPLSAQLNAVRAAGITNPVVPLTGVLLHPQ